MESMMTAQAMGHAGFYYQDSRHYPHHPAMQHMPMYSLPSTHVYGRPSSACSQPMVPTLYSNAPSSLTPAGSPAPMAIKPSMLDTEVCPSTPPLSTSGSVISSPGASDMLQTPMNPMFSGLDGLEGLKTEFKVEPTLIQEWNTACASPPMTPVYLGQHQAKSVALNSSFSSDLLSTASCPSLSPSPSPYARSVASTDEDVSFCDPRNLTVGASPSNPTLAPEFSLAALAEEELRSASTEAPIQPAFDFDATAIVHGLPTFDAFSELDSEEDFSQLISLPASDVRRPRACTGSSVVSLSHSFCDDDLCFEEPFKVEYMPSPPCSGSEDESREVKRIKKCNGIKAVVPCKINMANESTESTTNTQEQSNQAETNSNSSPTSEGSTPLPAPVNRRGRKQSLTEDPSKTFVCDICFRRFRRQEHLKRHYRSLHTHDKPFECNECGKKFSRSDNLAQHARTHGSGAIVMDIIDEATMHNMAMLGHHHPEDYHNMGKVLFQVAAEIPGSASELSSEDGMSDQGRKKRKRSE